MITHYIKRLLKADLVKQTILCAFVCLASLWLTSCTIHEPMQHINHHQLQVSSNNQLNYVSRNELKAYARQIIVAQGLDRYHIDRQWKIPSIGSLNAAQKVIAYILLDLRLATIDAYHYNCIPEVSFFRKRENTLHGVQKLVTDTACLATFRTVCPIDNSVVVNVCVEKCADGGVHNLQMTSSINDHQLPSQQITLVEAIGFAMKNLFERLSTDEKSFKK